MASGILGGGLVASLAVCIPTASVAVAQASQLIAVEGNRRVEADTIRSYFHLGPDQHLDAAKIDEGLKALYATGLFQDVRITQASGGRIIVSVIEAQVINRVQFEGNKRSKDEQLSQEVQSKPRGTLSRAMVQADVQRILEVYRRNGRYDVRVEPKIIELPNNRVDLVFEITEGQKTTVREIDFVGNKAYSAYRLKDVVKTGTTNILSFIKNNDIYDPDRIEADRDLLRRFYLSHGYADVRVTSATAEFDQSRNGFVITFTIDEGDLYHFGTVDIQSNVRDVDPRGLRGQLKAQAGGVYNAEAIEKSVEAMTLEVSKRGYAFAQVRPRGDRNIADRTINVVFVLEEGPRAYIERINIRGNTRTRDYVIRREFDIAEGDAYNKVLVDRAERRLKNLNYFKSVKITQEPGSAPDRVVLNVDVEEQPTGEFSVAGGYSTSDGFLAEVSVGERNLLGRGQYAKASIQYGQYARGFDVSFAEPYFLDYRLSLGLDVFGKETEASSFQSYNSTIIGGGVRLGIPLREDIGIQLRYSAYEQTITLPNNLDDCNNIDPNGVNTFPDPSHVNLIDPVTGLPFTVNCYAGGQASAAIKQLANAGPAFVSLVGYGVTYNTLDNNKNPTSGVMIEVRQDFAGVGGDVNFIKNTADFHYYHELTSDLVGLVRLQGGQAMGWGGEDLRMIDHFFMGPNLVRGFAPSGIGPRDMQSPSQDALGGSLYWGATLEFQQPIFGVPKDFGLKAAVFADAGDVWDYIGQRQFPATGTSVTVAGDSASMIRSSVGAGIIWDSPFGPLRFDYAYALTKAPQYCELGVCQNVDRLQAFRFGGGTKF